jgi:hypothetical protein
VRWLQTELRHVRFYKVGQKQMRERYFPRPRFFFVDYNSDDVAQAGISLLVVMLETVFQFRNRTG